MEVVQIFVPMPEIGDTVLPLTCDERRIVALEAKSELFSCKSARVSFRVVGGNEQFGVGSVVGNVAIGAFSVRDGCVVLVVELPEHLMALSAEGGLVAQEERAVFRGVGSVAIGTAAVRDRFVNHLSSIDHAVMAFLTKPFSRHSEEPWAV